MGAVRSGVRDNRVRGRVLEGEERIGEEIQGVGYASGPCLGDENVMAAIVRKSGRDPKTADAPQQVVRGDGWGVRGNRQRTREGRAKRIEGGLRQKSEEG